MYILAENARHYLWMIDLFNMEFEHELNDDFSELVREGIRIVNHEVTIELPEPSCISVINALIYRIAVQSELVGKGNPITIKDFMKFLGTTKPTVDKWSKWLNENAPAIEHLKLPNKMDLNEILGFGEAFDEEAFLSEIMAKHEDMELQMDQVDLFELIVKQPQTMEGFHAFELEARAYLETLKGPVNKFLKEMGNQPRPDLWLDWESRPYLSAKQQMASIYYMAGYWDQAILECKEILELSPNDGLGIRYLYLPLVIFYGDYATAKKIFADYEEESYAMYMNKALMQAAQNLPSATTSIKKAKLLNAHGVKILLSSDPHRDINHLPDTYTSGSLEEAEIYAFESGLIWREIKPAWHLLSKMNK